MDKILIMCNERIKKMKKIILCIALLAINYITVSAEESEKSDYSEEIKMFQNFYEDPIIYVFQDKDGNDVSEYVQSQKEAFKQDPYHTTDAMMEVVCSVQEDTPFISFYSANTVTWSRQKIYYKKTKYCLYTVIGTYNITNKKITSGKASAKIIDKGGAIYTIQYMSSNIKNSGKTIVYNVKHIINGVVYKTNHTKSI